MSTSGAFLKLISRTALSDAQARAFEGHKASIAARLRASFNVVQGGVKEIGSYARGSAIGSASDMDLLVVLAVEEVTWGGNTVSSTTTLDRVRRDLAERFPGTASGKDGQAIVVPFKGGDRPVDVVPGFYVKPNPQFRNYPIYGIPDGRGNWMATSPEVHAKFIADADAFTGGKLKHIAKLLKFWASLRTTASGLSGFHVELLLARERSRFGPGVTYPTCVGAAFDLLNSRRCRGLQDPTGVAGVVQAAPTASKLEQLVAAAATAAEHAKAARIAEVRGNVTEAVRQWNIVFANQFPSLPLHRYI